MELNVLSPKKEGALPSDYVSDPEEKEISDDDDDDRNHKHRRREAQSQSVERETFEYVGFNRKHNKPFENGHRSRADESQESGSWRNDNPRPSENGSSAKFARRRPGSVSLSQAPHELNQRRANQVNLAPGRGRGKDMNSWRPCDSRLTLPDIALQMAQRAPISMNMFPGIGLPGIPNARGTSWNPYGLIPPIPNGALDVVHPTGIQGAFTCPIGSLLNGHVPRQQCRDFEERGFCLRGDMCPMEHGVNRIVVEDVQSLSQFNLPVSLGSRAVPGSILAGNINSAALMNNGAQPKKSGKAGMVDHKSDYTKVADAGSSDLYDPDQPLWNSNASEASSLFVEPGSSKVDDTPSVSKDGVNDLQNKGLSTGGRTVTSKGDVRVEVKVDSAVGIPKYAGTETKENQAEVMNGLVSSERGKQIIVDDARLKAKEPYSKIHGDGSSSSKKPTQKAQRTLFVNGVPLKSNKKEALLSHFKRFGEVIDVYIPPNSEKAFVQFSTREEAEAALKSPDAVMGNRFIKLWWANRDNIPDGCISGGSMTSATPYGFVNTTNSHHHYIGNKENNDNWLKTPSTSDGKVRDTSVLLADQPNPATPSTTREAPVLQKKLQNLEQLKEELRKKQQMLEQKRNVFKRQLDKFQKQATGEKGEVVGEPASKKQKLGLVADDAKEFASRSSDGIAVTSSCSDMAATTSSQAEHMDKMNNLVENSISNISKTNSMIAQQGSSKHEQLLSLAEPCSTSFAFNRYRLDNRPTAFRVLSPLPCGFANVTALKDHFSSYGDLATVDLEDNEVHGTESQTSECCSAHIRFMTRHLAERAFANGKCWKGHILRFQWTSSSDSNGKKSSPPGSKDASEAGACPPVNNVCISPEEPSISVDEKSGNMKTEFTDNHTEPCGAFQPLLRSVSNETGEEPIVE